MKKTEIAEYLYSQAIPDTIRVLDLIILIDDWCEGIGGKTAIADTLKVALNENVAPCLIWTKHLLMKAIASQPIDLSQWIVVDLTYKELEGFLLIPKKEPFKSVNLFEKMIWGEKSKFYYIPVYSYYFIGTNYNVFFL